MATLSLQRRTVMRNIVRNAPGGGDTVAPWRLVDDVDGHFVDEADVLLEVHREWVRCCYVAGGSTSARSSPSASRSRCARMLRRGLPRPPTCAAILDANAAHPVLWEPTAQGTPCSRGSCNLAPVSTHPEMAATIGPHARLAEHPRPAPLTAPGTAEACDRRHRRPRARHP